MVVTQLKNGRPETQDERWERIKVEQKIRMKHLTDEVYQEAEDGAGWVLAEAQAKVNDEVARWRAANGVIVTIEHDEE
jgi:hypothetical protein